MGQRTFYLIFITFIVNTFHVTKSRQRFNDNVSTRYLFATSIMQSSFLNSKPVVRDNDQNSNTNNVNTTNSNKNNKRIVPRTNNITIITHTSNNTNRKNTNISKNIINNKNTFYNAHNYNVSHKNNSHNNYGIIMKKLRLRRQRIAPKSPLEKEKIFTIALIAIKAILFLIGVVGNFLIVIIIATNKSLHTMQNIFVFNLAVTDLFTLLVYLPLTVYKLIEVQWWVFGKFACIYILPIADIVPSVSILTLVAISVDRYRAITSANTYRSKTSTKSIAFVLIGIWSGCYLAVGLPVNFAMKYLAKQKMCFVYFESNQNAKLYFMARFVILYLLPSFIIFICYTRVNKTLVHSMRFLNRSVTAGKSRIKRMKRQKRVMAMFFAIFLTFAFCFLPFNLLIILYNYFPGVVRRYTTMLFYTMNLASTLAIANSVCNPLILYRLSSVFRAGFQSYLPFLKWYPQHRNTTGGKRHGSKETDELTPLETTTENTENQLNSKTQGNRYNQTAGLLSPQDTDNKYADNQISNTQQGNHDSKIVKLLSPQKKDARQIDSAMKKTESVIEPRKLQTCVIWKSM